MNTFPFDYFVAFWGVVGAVGAYLFYFRKDAGFKRKYFRKYAIFSGVVFVTVPVFTGFPWQMLSISVPFVALIIYLNVRTTRFCDRCGRTNFSQFPFAKPKFCSKCGGKLHD